MKKLRRAFLKAVAGGLAAAAIFSGAVACDALDAPPPQVCHSQSELSLPSQSQDPLITEAQKVLAREGAAIAELLGLPAACAQGITFKVNTQDDGVASTSGTVITLYKRYFDQNPDDLAGVTVHELTHAIEQGAVNSGDFGWMNEGIADFIRYKLGYGTIETGDPHKSYKVAAGFFNWLYERPDNKQTYYAVVKDVTSGIRPARLDDLLAQYNNGVQLKAPFSIPPARKPPQGPSA